MISKEFFLQKFPFFIPDKDGLVRIRNLQGGELTNEGYLLTDFFVPYSQYLAFKGTNEKECLNYQLLGYLKDTDVYIRFDIESIFDSKDYIQSELGGGGRGIPEFNISKLLSLKQDNLSEKHRVNSKFDDLMGNKIYKTEFYYQCVDQSIHIEEITDTKIDDYFANRFSHTIFKNSSTITHFDGAILLYDFSQKEERTKVSLDKKLKNAEKYIKIFRVDDELDIESWLYMTKYWFMNNELVEEWMEPKWYSQAYRHILQKYLDF